MAILKAEVDIDFKPILQLAVIFPELNGRFLALVGKRARVLLKEEYLSGQELMLNAYPKDKKGNYTIVSDVNKKRTQVKIYSYPVNLFERGRMLRSGKKERGKYIITRKLKQAVLNRTASYANEFQARVLEPELKKAGLK